MDGITTTVSWRRCLIRKANESPTGVTRFNWTTDFPHYRPLHFAVTIPTSYFMIPETADPPSLITIPAQSISNAHAARELSQSQELAIKHGTPAVLCSNGVSAVIDPAGRILFQQSGGQTWSLSLALWFREGEDRQWTGYESSYGAYLFGTAVAILSIYATTAFIGNHVQVETATGNSVSERDIWSSLNSVSSRDLAWTSRIWRSTTSFAGMSAPPT